jgi:PAS domain S-box-containing protein
MLELSSLYKTIFEKNVDAMIVIEAKKLTLILANEKAKKLLGIDDFEGESVKIKEFGKIYEQLKNSQQNIALINEKFILKDGLEISLQVNSSLIENKNADYILAIIKRTDEIDNMTERLIQADKLVLLGQLSAGIAHEIRNPLAAVNLNLQLLSRKFADGTNEYNSIQTALQGVERISRIVEITLNFSKPSKADIRELNINKLIPETLDLVSVDFKKKEVEVRTELDDKLPLIKADSKQIQQVLINLLTNAVESIEKRGRIIIKTGTDNKQIKNKVRVFFEVEDNGIGISKDEISDIFNPFFTKKTNGTGLGLTISKRIVAEHNGKIEVLSNVGKGTKFRVLLPV